MIPTKYKSIRYTIRNIADHIVYWKLERSVSLSCWIKIHNNTAKRNVIGEVFSEIFDKMFTITNEIN